MKKSVIAAALAGVMLLSGCSGVSQDEYNSLLEENSKLKESSSSSESTSSETSTSEASTSSSTESSSSSESSKLDESESSTTDSSLSSDDATAMLKEMLDSGEAIISPVTGTVWLYLEDNSAYVASVGTGIFAEASDEDKMGYCYLDAIYFASDEQFKDKYWLYLYWFDPNVGDGNTLGYCTITHLFGETSISNNSITWANEWEHFNESDTNKKYIEIVENFEFNSTDGNFELDGYKVNITGEYEFSEIDNQFSEYDGTPVVKIAANIENVSSEYDFCMLYCKITDPNGKSIDHLDVYFDDGIFMKQIEKGELAKRYFVIPYTGDGEYRLEFSDIVSEKYVYKIDVTKP